MDFFFFCKKNYIPLFKMLFSSKEISSLLQIGVTYNFDLCALRNVVYR
jgi:hypothetical protein